MDPFSEIDGIVEAKEEEISVKDSTLFKGKEEEGEELPYLDRFPRFVCARIISNQQNSNKTSSCPNPNPNSNPNLQPKPSTKTKTESKSI